MLPEPPPPNRAIGWYRFMLWMMPTCSALTMAVGFIWLTVTQGVNTNLLVLGWFVLNTITTVAIAIFEAKLRSRPDRPVSLKTDAGLIRFFLLQLLIVPVLSISLFVAVCSVGWY
jgi:hypothetical protein